MTRTVRVRYPPSPTGFCHVGTARMALLNFLFAKKHGGAIVFRVEDTDEERSKKEYEDDIIESFTWLGLSWDEFYRQSERTKVYQEAIKDLIDADKAYVSEEESKKNPGEKVHVVRLRNPGTRVTFVDIIRGEISFDTAELGDFAIARSLEAPLYHLSVVVDDEAMGITHIIRGEDHISNTPRQILIQEALGYSRPQYAHYPLHLAMDRSKLSKRKGDVAIRDYREKGYLSGALRNYLANLGWTPPSEREILTLDEMIVEFELTDVHKSGAVFDIEKLRWFNREYLLRLPESTFQKESMVTLRKDLAERKVKWDEKVASSLVHILRERISTWGDIHTLVVEGEFDYFFMNPRIDSELIPGKNSDAETAAKHLTKIKGMLSALSVKEFANAESVKASVWEYATKEGRGAVLWPLRYILTGRERSPDPFIVAAAIGKEAVLERIDIAREILQRP